MKNTKKRTLLIAIAALICLTACEDRKGSDSSQITSASQSAVSESDSSVYTSLDSSEAKTTTTTTTATTTSAANAPTTTAASTPQPAKTSEVSSSEAPKVTTDVSSSSEKQTTAVTPASKTELGNVRGKIGIGNYLINIHDIKDNPSWQFRYMYTANVWDTDICAYMIFDNYCCEIVATEKPTSVEYEQTLEYKGKTVRCHTVRSKALDGTSLFDSMTLHLYSASNYTIRIDITPGGKYKSAYYRFMRDGDYSEWLAKHRTEFDNISSDPKDYMYIFDSLEL